MSVRTHVSDSSLHVNDTSLSVEFDTPTLQRDEPRTLFELTRSAPPSSVPFAYDVAIIGLGYVGLPTALAFHSAGQRVIGLDVSVERLTAVAAQRVDLVASDDERLGEALEDDRFVLSADVARLAKAACVIVCVPTPVNRHLLPDLTILRSACASVVEHAVPGQTLILTSTTYVGCTEDLLVEPLGARGLMAGRDVYVAFSPERIDPGNDTHAHEDVPRVIGGATEECGVRAAGVLGAYARVLHQVSSTRAGELVKILENTFRAVNIAMANEMAEVSRVLELDVMEVIDAAATKPFGFMPFYPGPGVGGHCIPCDPQYLLWQLREHRLTVPVIEQAMSHIARRPSRVVDRAQQVLSRAGRALGGARVLVIGVAYKPDVEDHRESPALEILHGLLAEGAQVDYFDPFVPTVTLADRVQMASIEDPQGSLADLVILHTKHQSVDHEWLAAHPLVLDATYRLTSHPDRILL